MKAQLEKNTEKFIKDLAAQGGKPIYQLTPAEARAVLEKLQSGPMQKPDAKIEHKTIPVGPSGEVSLTIIRPSHAREKLPVIFYTHGAGWVMGSDHTHDNLVRELAVGTHSAVVFPNYSRSPEARYPIAIEECYASLEYIAENGKNLNLDTTHLAIAGDSVGGNMTAVLAMLAKERKGPKIACQVLLYPVTDAGMNTPSYSQFADGPWLTKPAMEYFWNAYEPNVSARKDPHMSPLQASLDQLKGLPPALVITDENDVLRDEGEMYAHKLMQAGVEVISTRYLGTFHDFMMLNALAHTPAVRGAFALTKTYLNEALAKQIKMSGKKAA